MKAGPYTRAVPAFFIEPKTVHAGKSNMRSSKGTLLFKDERKTCVVEITEPVLAQLKDALTAIIARNKGNSDDNT